MGAVRQNAYGWDAAAALCPGGKHPFFKVHGTFVQGGYGHMGKGLARLGMRKQALQGAPQKPGKNLCFAQRSERFPWGNLTDPRLQGVQPHHQHPVLLPGKLRRLRRGARPGKGAVFQPFI